MSRFQRIVDSCYRAFGQTAIYHPTSGSQKDLLLIPNRGDEVSDFGPTRISPDRFSCKIRTTTLPTTPQGGIIEFNDQTFRIKTAQYADPDRLEWILECYEDEVDIVPANVVTHNGVPVTCDGVYVTYTP